MELGRNKYYQGFKYLVYLLLAFNVVAFLLQAIRGAEITHSGGVGLGDIIVAYADPIDTAAWLVLLLMLELETYILDDEKLTGPLYWTINAINALCYAIIVYSFFGYLGMLEVTGGFAAYSGADACRLIGSGATYVDTIDEYVPIVVENCGALASGALHNAELDLFATPEKFKLLSHLVWLDIINSAVWLVVVTVLQLEVYLKSSKLFGTTFFKAYKFGKFGLYAILAMACILWTIWGNALDAWDAFLWLLAFFFIEMNLLDWQKELFEERAENAPDAGMGAA